MENLSNWKNWKDEEKELERKKRLEISNETNMLITENKQTKAEIWRLLEIYKVENLWYPVRSDEIELDVDIKYF